MRFTHNKVNFEVTYMMVIKNPQIIYKMFSTNFDDFQMLHQKWHHYVWT